MPQDPSSPAIQGRTCALFAARLLPFLFVLAACRSVQPTGPLVSGDRGTWGPWDILDASHTSPPAWTASPPSGTIVAEGVAEGMSANMRSARRLANLQLVQNAGLEAGVQVTGEFTRFDTQDSFRANARTSYRLNAELTVEVIEVYWERRQSQGTQMGLPATKHSFRVVLLGRLSS